MLITVILAGFIKEINCDCSNYFACCRVCVLFMCCVRTVCVGKCVDGDEYCREGLHTSVKTVDLSG